MEGGTLIRDSKSHTGSHNTELLKERIIGESTHTRNVDFPQNKEASKMSSKSIGFRRQNTGNGETLGSTLQESVLKMPIRYSLSSIREESKAANPY